MRLGFRNTARTNPFAGWGTLIVVQEFLRRLLAEAAKSCLEEKKDEELRSPNPLPINLSDSVSVAIGIVHGTSHVACLESVSLWPIGQPAAMFVFKSFDEY